MKRAYAELPSNRGEWQIHYRTDGQGKPLILLHPSPLSGAVLTAQIATLAPLARCIAWDTPGYGASDPLPASCDDDLTLAPYVEALNDFLTALNIDDALVYGSATGAQIAVEFAKAYPQRCSGLLLENVAAFTVDDIRSITEGYFPDFSPQIDGSHLTAMWDMARRTTRYFPWHSNDPSADMRDADAPVAVANGIFRDTFLAGERYDRAYRAAFANERLEELTAVTVPVRIVHWEDSILGEYGERIASASLPENIVVRHAGAGMDARLSTLRDAAAELLATP